jgi:hypothetical protein
MMKHPFSGKVTVALAGTVARKSDSAVVLSPFPQSDEMLVGNMTLCPAAAGNDVATMLAAPINAMLRHSMSTHFVRVTSRLLITSLSTITNRNLVPSPWPLCPETS